MVALPLLLALVGGLIICESLPQLCQLISLYAAEERKMSSWLEGMSLKQASATNRATYLDLSHWLPDDVLHLPIL